MRHTFNFKDSDNFGHIIYNLSNKQRGNRKHKKGYYSIYVICSQKEMKAILKRSIAYKIKTLKEEIEKSQKEVKKLQDELLSFLLKTHNP